VAESVGFMALALCSNKKKSKNIRKKKKGLFTKGRERKMLADGLRPVSPGRVSAHLAGWRAEHPKELVLEPSALRLFSERTKFTNLR
jgi:hypothetical protein